MTTHEDQQNEPSNKPESGAEGDRKGGVTVADRSKDGTTSGAPNSKEGDPFSQQ